MENEFLFMMEDNILEEEDYFLLRRMRLDKVNLHLELAYWKYDGFSLEDITNEECSMEITLRKNDMQYINFVPP